MLQFSTIEKCSNIYLFCTCSVSQYCSASGPGSGATSLLHSYSIIKLIQFQNFKTIYWLMTLKFISPIQIFSLAPDSYIWSLLGRPTGSLNTQHVQNGTSHLAAKSCSTHSPHISDNGGSEASFFQLLSPKDWSHSKLFFFSHFAVHPSLNLVGSTFRYTQNNFSLPPLLPLWLEPAPHLAQNTAIASW